METKINSQATTDVIKTITAVMILVAGVFGFYSYSEISDLYRIVALIVVAGIALLLYCSTAGGQNTLGFLRSAHGEIWKVVWPTWQETSQTTLVVLVVVVIFAIILWLLDLILSSLVNIVI